MDLSKHIKIIQNDITNLPFKVDAIVNAANSSLLGGGGVDGAIHKVAGPELLQECKTLHGCPVGEAKLTKAYKLNANYVIHTVGPKYDHYLNDKEKADALLVNCYKSIVKVALQNNIKTIAIPSIATGIYHFPLDRAARLAIRTLKNELTKMDKNKYENMKFIFVCFDKITYLRYLEALLINQAGLYLTLNKDKYNLQLNYVNDNIVLETKINNLDYVLAYFDLNKSKFVNNNINLGKLIKDEKVFKELNRVVMEFDRLETFIKYEREIINIY